MSPGRKLAAIAGGLRRSRRGVALLEFALMLPVLLVLSLTGAELTNYITTRMRISQLALHLADNAARIGSGSQLAQKTITETDINDLLTGAGLQAGELDLYNRGRVIISDLEPDPSNTGKYKIMWQRCRGAKTSHASRYGTYGQSSGSNMTGMGETGRLVTAPSDGATMFVEVYYEYQPLVKTSLAPSTSMDEIASMMVRDRRDLTQVYPSQGVTPSTCS